MVVSGVRPIDSRSCESRGSALSLGGGLFLTAAHVLLGRADLVRECGFTAKAAAAFDRRAAAGDSFTIRVRTTGKPFVDGAVAAAGRRILSPFDTMSFAGSSDYALIRADLDAPGAPLRPCAAPPKPGQPAIVVLHDGPVRTTVAATQTPKSGDDSRYIDLDTVFENGTSGAGVLDAMSHCVMGIISHRFPEPAPRVTRMTDVAVFAAAWRKAQTR